jgi:hypothetical protein
MVLLGQAVEVWDTARYMVSRSGTQTAALAFGGDAPTNSSNRRI